MGKKRRAKKQAAVAPVERRVWTPRRCLLFCLLVGHWLAVLVFALPDAGWREPLLRVSGPVLALDTHPDAPLLRVQHDSWIQRYLRTTQQVQRWKMFILRRPNVVYLQLEGDDGPKAESFLLRERAPAGMLRRCRWNFLESALLNPDRRDTYLPRALPALAQRLFREAPATVTASKLAYPVPLLNADGTGNPLFLSAGAWQETVGSLTNFVVIPMARVDGPGGRP